MNMLSKLQSIVHKRSKRLGRGTGSGRGAKSGRGTTRHQTARQDMPISFEGGQNRMVKRFPLLRGKGHNNSRRKNPLIISLSTLNNLQTKSTVTIDTLVKAGIIEEKEKYQGVKVIANGTIEKALTVALPVSGSSRLAIEKAGGKVQ